MVLKQESRSLRIATPLGPDKVQLLAFSGQEELSRLFEFHLDLISEDNAIQAEDIVGKNVTFCLTFHEDEEQRWFNGFVRRFSAGDENVKEHRSYQLSVVPWLWFLTQTSDCRIFQEQTAVQIIEKIFTDLQFTDFDTSGITGDHPQREYCVQYRETDFDFVSRLMEEEGIFYHFEHADGAHKLVLADSPSAYFDCKESTVDFPTHMQEGMIAKPHIDSWEHFYEFRSGKVASTDYNFTTPKTSLMVNEQTLMKYQNSKSFEVYDYPGEYPDKGHGASLARVRMEELEASHDLVRASSTCKSFSPGGRFKIDAHPSQSEAGKSYVIKSIVHAASADNYSSGEAVGGSEYSNQFSCFPDQTSFRPARLTPKPVIQGCQTAIVTGPPGEEIYVDEFGRVKVHFHWDRESPPPDKTSCWMRVSQVHAGKSFGGIDIPRIGEEVIVSFLEGDPDRPLITGRVYHQENMPPFGLPDSKNISGMKSNSTKEGGGGYNEFVMDDSKNKELIRLHAQYDMDSTILHDDRQTVKNNRTITVEGTHTETITKDTKIKITEGNFEHDVVAGKMKQHVAKAVTEIYEDKQSTTVKKMITIQSTDDEILVDAKKKIVLHSGKSTITLSEDGTIELKGVKINVFGDDIKAAASKTLESTGGKKASLGVGNQNITCDLTKTVTSGAAINSSAVGMHEITGALVKIN